jgi:hypothetical protein
MKYSLIAISILLNPYFSTAVKMEQATEATRSTHEEMEATRRRITEYYNKIPSKERPLSYIAISDDKLVPAYIDSNRMEELRWKGVELRRAQIPELEADGSFGIFPIVPTGFKVLEIDPPIRYYLLDDYNLYGIGYYDSVNLILYKWDGVEINRKSIPKDALAQGMILDASKFKVAIIPPPSSFNSKEGNKTTRISVNTNEKSPKPKPMEASENKNPSTLMLAAENPQIATNWFLWAASITLAIAGAGVWCMQRRQKS